MSERIQPFSNGGEYRNWLAHNCDLCKKAGHCPIEYALEFASGYDGLIGKRAYDRMGTDSGKCPEKEAVR
jgi:hypothetical protein